MQTIETDCADGCHAAAARAAVESWVGPDLHDLVVLARDFMEVSLAAICVLDQGRFHFFVAAGGEPSAAQEDEAICGLAMFAPDIFEVPDTRADVRTAHLPYVDGRLASFRFYASAPVRAAGGVIVGRFCVFDSAPRTLLPAQHKLLAILAENAGDLIQGEVKARLPHQRRARRQVLPPRQ